VLAIKLYLVVLLVFLVGCEAEYSQSLSIENTVYEALFLAIKKDAISPYYLVDKTEALWFKENAYDPDGWEDLLASNSEISLSVVKSLYNHNTESQSLNWKPIITNATLLPAKFADLNSENREDLCLVSADKPHIGVGSKDGGFFRPFYTVSRVGFSHEGKFALVKYSRRCAPLSGAGEFLVLLKFTDKQWLVSWSKILWVS